MNRKIMNRITVIVFALLVYFPVVGSAGQVSIEKARIVAQNWLYHTVSAYGSWAGSVSPTISGEETIVFKGREVGFNFLISPKGNILITARDDIPPVKLYSDTSTLSIYADATLEQSEWIAEEIFQIGEAIDSHSGEMAAMDLLDNPDVKAWALFGMEKQFEQEYLSYYASGTEFLSIGPLLTTTWTQEDPYNLTCPMSSTGCRTIVGCVATAASQIMRFWSKPTTGAGSTSYVWNGVTLSRNFASSTYDWANMPIALSGGSTTTQKNAVSQLCGDVGVAFHMDYGCAATGGSGAYTSDAPSVFMTYFKYKNTATWVKRSSYASSSAFMQVFKNEVQNGRPSQLSIRDPNAGGHSVVVDGYRDSPAETVHINMGWAGSYDGWYVPDSFITGTYHWTDTSSQGAAIGIQPSVTTGTSNQIIGTWPSGIHYWNVSTSSWTQTYTASPSGDIAAGDFNGDGKADIATCWDSGLWWQNGATLGWTKVYSTAPYVVTAGNVTGS